MYAISPLCVSSVDQPIFMFSFPERFEFFFFATHSDTSPSNFSDHNWRLCFQWNGNTRVNMGFCDSFPHLFGQNVFFRNAQKNFNRFTLLSA